MLVAALKAGGSAPGESAVVMERPWVQMVLEAADGPRRLALICEHGTDIYRRVAPMFHAVNAAASVDPAVEDAWRGMVETRRNGMRQLINAMAERGELRAGVDLPLAADILFGLQRPELYLAFTVECGWTPEMFKAWLYVALCRQLLPSDEATAALADASTATADLSFASSLRSFPVA